ncbi:Pantoate--beta-alanine ligase [hydrothermal vent metagenome]|uniref:pantoate--beta-alanine ligase (AMP-forming) n=1 Tax=hydrothermal vent metagenome TaxID=652676 RepID=A0A3B0YZA6_9ZZZZ
MQQVQTTQALQNALAPWRACGETIVFVPTMGNLHDGHLALVKRARELATVVVVSLFVNPLQFCEGDDFTDYPRTLEQDCARLKGLVDVIFTPAVTEVYGSPIELSTRVEVPGVSDILCGAYRPGHFVGVATVVAKLFNMVRPDVAVFGEKDFQQLFILRAMVEDLAFPVVIEGVPTVRELDGLAMSSRNQYLSASERKLAPKLYQTLLEVRDAFFQQSRPIAELEQKAKLKLKHYGFEPDYVSIRNANDLTINVTVDGPGVILAAAYLGGARLIDNISWG